jgi:hypothetical protein
MKNAVPLGFRLNDRKEAAVTCFGLRTAFLAQRRPAR